MDDGVGRLRQEFGQENGRAGFDHQESTHGFDAVDGRDLSDVLLLRLARNTRG